MRTGGTSGPASYSKHVHHSRVGSGMATMNNQLKTFPISLGKESAS